MDADLLLDRIRSGQSPPVLDVRTSFEFSTGHIEGAIHAPPSRLFEVASLCCKSRTEMLVLTCEHGPRAQFSKALLWLRGYRNVELLSGHMAAWRRAGRPMETKGS